MSSIAPQEVSLNAGFTVRNYTHTKPQQHPKCVRRRHMNEDARSSSSPPRAYYKCMCIHKIPNSILCIYRYVFMCVNIAHASGLLAEKKVRMREVCAPVGFVCSRRSATPMMQHHHHHHHDGRPLRNRNNITHECAMESLVDAGRSLRTDIGRWPQHTRTRTRTHNRSSITAHPNAECRALAELTSACAYDWRINVFERQTAV